MRPAHETDQFFDFLVASLQRFGKDIPEMPKRLVINSFDGPENLSKKTEGLQPLLAVLGATEDPETKIAYRGNWDLNALVHCTKDWNHSLLRYTGEVLSDPIQMMVASFWIFEGLKDMPELAAAKEAIRDWKEAILHELLKMLTNNGIKNKTGLKIVLPLVDELLAADRACPSYNEVQRMDSGRYSRRSDIVNWIYEIAMEPASNAPTLYTDEVKMKFKAALAFLIQLDKEEVETLMIEPMLNDTMCPRTKWRTLVNHLLGQVDHQESMAELVPAISLLFAIS